MGDIKIYIYIYKFPQVFFYADWKYKIKTMDQ